MKKSYNHINVLSAENPVRMGFYVPGHGIVTRTNAKPITMLDLQKEILNYANTMAKNKH